MVIFSNSVCLSYKPSAHRVVMASMVLHTTISSPLLRPWRGCVGGEGGGEDRGEGEGEGKKHRAQGKGRRRVAIDFYLLQQRFEYGQAVVTEKSGHAHNTLKEGFVKLPVGLQGTPKP